MMVRSIRPMLLLAGVLGFAQVQANEGYSNTADGELWCSGVVIYLAGNAGPVEVGAGQRGPSATRATS